MAKDVVRKLAARVHRDPTAASIDDAKKLAAAVLMLVDGRLPRRTA